MPPLKVASFGRKGVNVVDSPLHLSDDDLAAAQNAEIFFEDGHPAIRKRLGMATGLVGTMDGAVLALTSVPLPDPSDPPPLGYVATNALVYWHEIVALGGDLMRSSPDGAAWADDVTLQPARAAFDQHVRRFCQIDETLYYPGWSGASAGLGRLGLYAWDGSSSTLVYEFPDIGAHVPTSARAMATDGTDLYVAVYHTNPSLRVRTYRVTTAGVGSAVGEDFGAGGTIVEDSPTDLEWWNGRLWIVNGDGSPKAIKVRSIDPDTESAWSAAETFGGGATTDYHDNQLASAGLRLILIAVDGGSDTPMVVRSRDLVGTWSTIYSSPVGVAGALDKLNLVWCDTTELLLVQSEDKGVTYDVTLLRSTDFASFAAVADIELGAAGPFYGSPAIQFGDTLYWVSTGWLGAVGPLCLQWDGATVTLADEPDVPAPGNPAVGIGGR